MSCHVTVLGYGGFIGLVKVCIAQHSYVTGHGVLFNSIKILHKEHKKRRCLIK